MTVTGRDVEVPLTDGSVETVQVPSEMPWTLYQKLQKKVDATVEIDDSGSETKTVENAGKVAADIQNTIITYLVTHDKWCDGISRDELTRSGGRRLVKPFEDELEDLGMSVKKK